MCPCRTVRSEPRTIGVSPAQLASLRALSNREMSPISATITSAVNFRMPSSVVSVLTRGSALACWCSSASSRSMTGARQSITARQSVMISRDAGGRGAPCAGRSRGPPAARPSAGPRALYRLPRARIEPGRLDLTHALRSNECVLKARAPNPVQDGIYNQSCFRVRARLAAGSRSCPQAGSRASGWSCCDQRHTIRAALKDVGHLHIPEARDHTTRRNPPPARPRLRADADVYGTRRSPASDGPLYPGDDGACTATHESHGRRLPPCNGRSLSPRYHNPSRDVFLTRHQQRFTGIHPSRPFPSPVAPRRNGNPWALPWAPHPAEQDPAAHARAGTSLRHWPGVTSSPSATSLDGPTHHERPQAIDPPRWRTRQARRQDCAPAHQAR